MDIQAKLDALARQPFRAKFRLSQADLEVLQQKGFAIMRQHAREILEKRLFPAHPPNDGKQTPMRGYPVFVAQHATATCCRSCLFKWHGIKPGNEVAGSEREYILNVIEAWLRRQLNSPH